MQQLFGYEGVINELVVQIKDEALTDDIKKELEYTFKHYGLISVGDRDDQASYMMMDNELMGLESMGYSYPMIFLLIGSIVIYMLLLRLVDNSGANRGTDGPWTYKRSILFHYLGYALFVGLPGQ